MVHTAISKKIGCILIILLFGLTSLAQEQVITEPSFEYNDGKKHVSNLHYFLGTFKPVELKPCLFAQGNLSFRISKIGKVIDFNVTGNLPDTLISTLKSRIFQTEGHWKFNSKTLKSKWFVLPIFIKREGGDCTPDRQILESSKMITQMFDGNQPIISTKERYILQPFFFTLME